MGMDALKDLKRSKRKSEALFNKELNDLKGIVNENEPRHPRYNEVLSFILDNAEKDRADKRKRVVLVGSSSGNARGHDDENQPAKRQSQRQPKVVSKKQPVKKGGTSRGKSCARAQQGAKGKMTQKQVKSRGVKEGQTVKRNEPRIKKNEGKNAGPSNPVSEKQCERAQGKTREKRKAKFTEDEPVKRNIILKIKEEGENADTSNPVQCERAQEKGKAKVMEDEPVKRNILLKIKEGKNADTSNPVSGKQCERAQDKTQEKGKAKVTEDEPDKSNMSNPASGKQCERAQDKIQEKGKAKAKITEDEQVTRNILLKIKEGENTDTSNPVSGMQCERVQDKTQEKGKEKVTEDEQVKRNILLKIKEGNNAGTSNPVSEKQCEQAQDKTQEKGKAKITEDEPVKRNILLKIKEEGENADTSNPMSEKQCEQAQGKTQEKAKGIEDEPVKNKRILQIQVRVEGQKAAYTITPLSKMIEVIEIDDDDEDEDLDDQPGPEDKGVENKGDMSSPVSEGAPPSEMKLPSGRNDKGKSVPYDEGILSPLLPSRLFNDANESELAFRDEVLNVLRKPFDLDEYIALQDAMMAGSFLDHYEDVKRLVLSQHKREKRLAILRGFFFWLQNKDREGAFRPWNDCVCLEVDPAHVGNN